MLELQDIVVVILEAAQRPLTICEIAHECEPYVEGLISYFDVKQVCMSLFVRSHLAMIPNQPPGVCRQMPGSDRYHFLVKWSRIVLSFFSPVLQFGTL